MRTCEPTLVQNQFLFFEYENIVLKRCRINEEFSNTIYDYARFLKVLNLRKFIRKVDDWIKLFISSKSPSDGTSRYHMINLLFKLFIESGAILHKFSLHFSESIEFKPEIFYSLEQNVQCFSQIQHLTLYIKDLNVESVTTLLRALAKNATKIRTLKFREYPNNGHDNDNDMLQIIHTFIYIIKSQEQLRIISLVGVKYFTKFHGFISALES
ncbi:hypothetical protein F8M41_001836 [Gigaspora margarita]|uniref:Uncharacterized protein n=1 Tax=Gigaspora margarita TaxID=4874 RepID=A0A8H4AYY1_GIGMA|nr:hypothetical protein F8M41_001836 [Gigaspora margarita]